MRPLVLLLLPCVALEGNAGMAPPPSMLHFYDEDIHKTALVPLNSKCQPMDPKKCPTGRPAATWCYGSGQRMQKFGGGVKARDWCNRRDAEGCGCNWVPTRKPYKDYGQDKWKDKGNYGYCCYTSCTSIGNKGNQCCACGGGASTATRSGGKTGTCDPQTCTAVSGCTTAAVCNAARKGSDCCQWRAGGCHQSSSCGSGATTASAAGCAGCSDPSKFEWQTDYHGADLIKGGLQASSPAECCKKCEVTASCKYWTYGTANPRKGTCWLKSGSSRHESQANRESGVVCRTAAAANPTPAPVKERRTSPGDGIKFQPRDPLNKIGANPKPDPKPLKPRTTALTNPPTHFPAFENQMFYTAPPATSCGKVDVALVIDASYSIGNDEWLSFMSFTRQLLKQMTISADSVNAGIIMFGRSSAVRQSLTANEALLQPKLKTRDGVDGGGTYMSRALKDAELMLAAGRKGTPKMLVMLTDGLPSDKLETDRKFAQLKRASVTVMMVLIGGAIRAHDVSSWTSIAAVEIGSFNALATKVTPVKNQLCIAIKQAVQKARPCGTVDVALIIDASASIFDNEWQQQMKFARELVDRMGIADDGVHAGVVMFGYTSVVVAKIAASKSAINPVLSSRSAINGGGTMMSLALAQAEDMLAHARQDKPKVVLMLTDGLPSPSDRVSTDAAFTKLKNGGYQVMMVLIGGAIKAADVAAWVTRPALEISGFDALDRALDSISSQFCDTVTTAMLAGPPVRPVLPDPTPPPPTPPPTVATTAPSAGPSTAPTAAPSMGPTIAPSAAPTVAPTVAPSVQPSVAPTTVPTALPTPGPTAGPTQQPTAAPTQHPTEAPTEQPTAAPTVAPTAMPTAGPTFAPTAAPSMAPTAGPTSAPTTTGPSGTPTTPPPSSKGAPVLTAGPAWKPVLPAPPVPLMPPGGIFVPCHPPQPCGTSSYVTWPFGVPVPDCGPGITPPCRPVSVTNWAMQDAAVGQGQIDPHGDVQYVINHRPASVHNGIPAPLQGNVYGIYVPHPVLHVPPAPTKMAPNIVYCSPHQTHAERCNGHGRCTTGTCVCDWHWYGVRCDSQVPVAPPPVTLPHHHHHLPIPPVTLPHMPAVSHHGHGPFFVYDPVTGAAHPVVPNRVVGVPVPIVVHVPGQPVAVPIPCPPGKGETATPPGPAHTISAISVPPPT